jgi:hypothetical protein
MYSIRVVQVYTRNNIRQSYIHWDTEYITPSCTHAVYISISDGCGGDQIIASRPPHSNRPYRAAGGSPQGVAPIAAQENTCILFYIYSIQNKIILYLFYSV